jgi:phospholipase/carboxylesterase
LEALHNALVDFVAVARPPSEANAAAPVLILLHGLAADESDLIGLAAELNPSLYVLSLRAPHQTGYGGYSWFGIEFLPDGSRLIDEEQAITSRSAVISALETLPSAIGFQPSRLVLGGFSQGAMMAAAVLLERPELLDGAWLMSGRPLPFFSAKTADRSLPVLIQHGRYDEVLAIHEGRALAELLKSTGHDVQYTEYAMGHQISNESLQEGSKWLDRTLVR